MAPMTCHRCNRECGPHDRFEKQVSFVALGGSTRTVRSRRREGVYCRSCMDREIAKYHRINSFLADVQPEIIFA